jgi:hypothetical protein
MRVLVTGSTGLIGSALVPFLRAAGHDVIRLARVPLRAEEKVVLWDPEAGKIEPSELEGIEAVVHLAERISPDAGRRRRRLAFETVGCAAHGCCVKRSPDWSDHRRCWFLRRLLAITEIAVRRSCVKRARPGEDFSRRWRRNGRRRQNPQLSAAFASRSFASALSSARAVGHWPKCSSLFGSVWEGLLVPDSNTGVGLLLMTWCAPFSMRFIRRPYGDRSMSSLRIRSPIGSSRARSDASWVVRRFCRCRLPWCAFSLGKWARSYCSPASGSSRFDSSLRDSSSSIRIWTALFAIL